MYDGVKGQNWNEIKLSDHSEIWDKVKDQIEI